MHLLLPLLASLLFVVGLILIKRANAAGMSTVTTLFISNQCTALAFSTLWLLGGDGQPAHLLWQPTLIACLYITGLWFTFLAINRGDVSIATPVFGVKVLLVALLVTAMGGDRLSASVWYAAALAALGIALIQWTGGGKRGRVVTSILFAVLSSLSYALFDVLVQRWSPAWGTGRLLPFVFGFVSLLSLTMLPWVNWRQVMNRQQSRFLWPGSLFIACQAICIVVTLSVFGDAVRVNVVYALRGLWGVGITWWVAQRWGGADQILTRPILLLRMSGAILLTAAVVLAVTAR